MTNTRQFRRSMTPAALSDYLMARVEFDTNGGCWLWTAHRNNFGYGSVYHEGKRQGAHRVAYKEAYGKAPLGRIVCHRCDVRLCVNPNHLYAGSHLDNARDRDTRGRGVYVRGSRQGLAKLTEADIPRIRKRISDGEAVPLIAALYGVSPSAIHSIKSGRSWSHIP